MRQEVGAVHMQPMQHPIHADACLISMLEMAGNNQLGNALDRRSQPLCCQFAPLQQGSFRDLALTDYFPSVSSSRPLRIYSSLVLISSLTKFGIAVLSDYTNAV
jgi:hypothetical protein